MVTNNPVRFGTFGLRRSHLSVAECKIARERRNRQYEKTGPQIHDRDPPDAVHSITPVEISATSD